MHLNIFILFFVPCVRCKINQTKPCSCRTHVICTHVYTFPLPACRSQSRYFEINSVSNRRRILLFILLYCSYLLNPHCYQVPSSAPYTAILPVLQVKHHSILYWYCTLLFCSPTCLCREPRLDPDCNQFKEFLIDHPCLSTKYKGRSSLQCVSSTAAC